MSVNSVVMRAIASSLTVIVMCGVSFGCMKRRERWSVNLDGSVHAQLEFETQSEAELYDGDATPSLLRGWLVEETRSGPDEEGRETITLDASARFGPESMLPEHYGDGLLDDPDIYLHFPTTVRVENRRDGTYYHFHRTYRARPWSRLARPREAAMEQYKALLDRPFESLTPAEREQYIRALATIETFRFMAIAWLAYQETAAEHVPQDVWLSIRSEMQRATENRDYQGIARMLGSTDVPPDQRGLQRESEQFEHAVLQAIKDGLHSSQYFGPTKFNEFSRRFKWHRRFHEITEDLQDDDFQIEVQMPGQIVGHNADSLVGTTARWVFNGKMIFDRDQELMVTSVVRTGAR